MPALVAGIFQIGPRPLIGGQIKEAPPRKKTSSPRPPLFPLPRRVSHYTWYTYIQEPPRDSSNDSSAPFLSGSSFFNDSPFGPIDISIKKKNKKERIGKKKKKRARTLCDTLRSVAANDGGF